MTVLERLPRDDEGFIVLEGAAVVRRGEEEIRVDALTTEEILFDKFGELVHASTPMTQEQFDALMDASPPKWQEQWRRWRDDGVI